MTDEADPVSEDTTFRTFIADEFKSVNVKIDAQGVTLKDQDAVLKKQDELLEKMVASAEKSAAAHSKMVELVQQALDIAADNSMIKHDIKGLRKDVSDHDFRLERLELHTDLKKASTD